MAHRALATAVIISLMAVNAQADNAMGYRAVTTEEAAALPARQGSLGMSVEASQRISDSGMRFELLRVKQVRAGSPAQRAGFHPGDQIIAVDGRVFPSLAIFGAYIGALPPGSRAAVDYIPSGQGPANAQRVTVALGQGVQPGLSTGEKVAIGVGAAALLGCYEMGCFAPRHGPQPAQAPNPGR